MTIEECIKKIKEKTNQKVEIQLKGIITTQIKIKELEINYENYNLILKEKIEKENKIEFNMYQLRKASIVENQIVLEFEQLQNVYIK
mgnify:CR=1 FL=1